MIEIVEPCKRCGAPPRYRLAVDDREVHFSQQYCPVCDIPSPLPFRWHRAAVWLLGHLPAVRVRFREGWCGPAWQGWSRYDPRYRRRKPKPFYRVSGSIEDDWGLLSGDAEANPKS